MLATSSAPQEQSQKSQTTKQQQQKKLEQPVVPSLNLFPAAGSTEPRSSGVVYDPIPFLATEYDASIDHFGHMIVLSDDTTGVAYFGLNAHVDLGPLDDGRFHETAHSMGTLSSGTTTLTTSGTHVNATTGYPTNATTSTTLVMSQTGYLNRLTAIWQTYSANASSFPVRTSGFAAGSFCSDPRECRSKQCAPATTNTTGTEIYQRCLLTNTCALSEQCVDPSNQRCEAGYCVPKLGSCMRCNAHADCRSGQCGWNFRCVNSHGLMDDHCSCASNTDCQSGRCEGVFARTCEPKLQLGARCNEASDCVSGQCSWHFLCEEPSTAVWGGGDVLPTNIQRKSLLAEEDDAAGEEQQVDDDYDDQLTGHPKHRKGILGTVLLGGIVVLALSCLTIRWVLNRRRGYEEIPVKLDV